MATKKPNRKALTKIAKDHGLTIETAKNQAGYLLGTMESLDAAWKAMWDLFKFSPRFVVSSTERNKPAPRIEIHPQVWGRTKR